MEVGDRPVVRFEPPRKPAAAGTPPAARPSLPFQAGVARRVTDQERAVLEQIGWKPGDPVPADLAAQLAAARARAAPASGGLADHMEQLAARDRSELAAELRDLEGRPPLAFDPDAVPDAAQLPAAARAELSRKFADMQAVVESLKAAGPAEQLAPGVAAAIAMAAAPPPPAGPPPAPPVAAAPEPDPPPSATGLNAAPKQCPHCHWDLARTDLPEPTDAEKRQYLTACIAGARYTREAAVLGGRVRLEFRELTPGETEAIFAQVARESPADAGYGQYVAKVLTYQMAASLAAVVRDRVYPVPTIAQAEAGGADEPLPALLSWIRTQALPTESLFKMAAVEYGRFRAGLERMTAMAADPDFFGGIPGPA